MWYPNVDDKLYLKIQEQEFRKLRRAVVAGRSESSKTLRWRWALGVTSLLNKTLRMDPIQRRVIRLLKQPH